MSGPIASPMPEAADHAVMTSVRRCGSVKVAPRIARLFGRIRAPPRPATNCPTITQATVGGTGHHGAANDHGEDAGTEHAPASVAVAQGGGGQHHARHHQGVGAGDPDQGGRVDPKIPLDGRQGGDRRGDLEERDHRAQAHGDQGHRAGAANGDLAVAGPGAAAVGAVVLVVTGVLDAVVGLTCVSHKPATAK